MNFAQVRLLPDACPVPIASGAPGGARRSGYRQLIINGRFLGQPQTGVQRYARQIVSHLDQIFDDRSGEAHLIVPRGRRGSIALRRIKMRESRVPGGAVWEQVVLPAWRGSPTLNLCNTAPLVGRRTIVCIHDCNVFDVPDAYSRAFRSYYRCLLPLLARGSIRIATVSRYSARRISHRLGVPLGKIEVLSNGFEHALSWCSARSTLKPLLDLNPRPFILLLGSITRHKNAALVLALASRLETLGIGIKVVGSTAGIYASTSFEHDANIEWLGRVSDDDLALLMDRALCLAFPSTSEGFGLPVVEAMARGCPVVSSDRSSLPEVCGNATLLADPDDPAAWLAHFASLAASASLREDLAWRGRERSRSFSWRASAEGYIDMVRRYA